MKRSFFIARLLRMLGMAIIVLAGVFLYEDYKFSNNARQTEGTIIRFDTQANKSYPILRFHETETKTITLKSPKAINKDRYKVGDQLNFFYDRHNYDHIKFPTFWSEWGIILLEIAGLTTFLLGFFLTKRLQKRQPKPQPPSR